MGARRGLFITLEGGEGAGKSTQLPLIAAVLLARGYTVLQTREPGGSPGAEAIRALLMTGNEDRWSARSEALLFAAARADHVEKTIIPAIESGAIVLCDRFIDSSRAYQGGAGGLEDADILALHQLGSKDFLPDRTLLFVLPPGESAVRAAARDKGNTDRMGSKSSDYYARVDQAFQKIANQDPQRVRSVDAQGTISDVTARVLAALEDLL